MGEGQKISKSHLTKPKQSSGFKASRDIRDAGPKQNNQFPYLHFSDKHLAELDILEEKCAQETHLQH